MGTEGLFNGKRDNAGAKRLQIACYRATDIGNVNSTLLNNYDVVILGHMPLSSGQVTMFTNWVTAGGNLIAMRPDAQLASLLGDDLGAAEHLRQLLAHGRFGRHGFGGFEVVDLRAAVDARNDLGFLVNDTDPGLMRGIWIRK